MKAIDIKAGQRTKIISRISNSIPATYRFEAEALSDATGLSGTVEVKGSNWLFPKAAVEQPLQPVNSVEKTMWDTFYKVYVTPQTDVRITMAGSSFPGMGIILAIAGLVVIAAASIMIFAAG